MYFPAAHSSQNVDPASEAPVVQFWHAACLGWSEYQFAGHALQSSASVLPEVLEYLPGAQSLHPVSSFTPSAEEYVALGHSTHATLAFNLSSGGRPDLPCLPAAHGVQPVAVVWLLTYSPLEHVRQALDPN